jgi:hypothetical protein
VSGQLHLERRQEVGNFVLGDGREREEREVEVLATRLFSRMLRLLSH